jgi:hypothetical protein
MTPVHDGPVESRWLPTTRCNGEGLGSEVVGLRTRFGAAERRGLIGAICLLWCGLARLVWACR